jgi:ribosomal protein L11 methyltransferase
VSDAPYRTWPTLQISGLSETAADLLQADLLDFDVEAIDESQPASWRIFFRTTASRDLALAHVRRAFPAAAATPLAIADENWAARSQAGLKAVTVGGIVVAPPWDVPLTIVIQPSMGFGTGHHATTRQCLMALQRLDVKGRDVLDAGTGSGVLAIAASRMGAASVRACDDDADAVHAAWENLALNPGATVSMLVGDLRTLDLEPAHIVLANITGALLIATASRLMELANSFGYLILSGFQEHEERDITAAFEGATVVERFEEDGWVAVVLRKEQ